MRLKAIAAHSHICYFLAELKYNTSFCGLQVLRIEYYFPIDICMYKEMCLYREKTDRHTMLCETEQIFLMKEDMLSK